MWEGMFSVYMFSNHSVSEETGMFSGGLT
jgi:hypothetical protein